MPEYKYKCESCSGDWFTDLPISFDPKQKLKCPTVNCKGRAVRKIGFKHLGKRNNIVMKRGSTVGQWYKNETGKDLLGE